jgi:hypothetical protein
MQKKAKKTDWKFERSHVENLPLHIVMDMCSPGQMLQSFTSRPSAIFQ